jgi:hypothetical protein
MKGIKAGRISVPWDHWTGEIRWSFLQVCLLYISRRGDIGKGDTVGELEQGGRIISKYLKRAAHRQRREGTLTFTGKTFSRLRQQASMEYILGRGSGNFPDSKASPTGVHGGHPPGEVQDIFHTPPTMSMEYCTSSVEFRTFSRLHQHDVHGVHPQ